jgi:hypothetical protein
MATADVKRYWDRVAALRCVVCYSPAEIAHAHGPSVTLRMMEPKAKGKKLARYDWLVLPLCPHHHRWNHEALDNNPRRFEECHGKVADWIDYLCAWSGLNLWALADGEDVA